MPAPMTETLRDVALGGEALARRSRVEIRSRIGSARSRSFSGSVNEMSASPSTRGVLDDLSMLIPASASGRNVRPATPGRSGTRADRHLRLAGVVRDSRDDRLLEHVLLLDDPRALGVVERRADVDLDAVVASVLDRAQRQDARARAPRARASPRTRPASSLRALGHDPRVGACRRRRRRCRSRRRRRRARPRARPRSCRSRRARAS